MPCPRVEDRERPSAEGHRPGAWTTDEVDVSKDSRRRYLRTQRERLARVAERATRSAAPGSLAEVICEGCGLHFTADIPVMGFSLEIEYLDPDGTKHRTRSTIDESAVLVPCPRCDSGGRVLNEQQALDAEGVRHIFFASGEAEREAVLEALDLFDSGEPLSVHEIITELESRGPLLAALATWVRTRAASVPAIVLEVVLTVVLTHMLSGGGITEEELDRILDEHSREHQRQERPDPGERSRNSPDPHPNAPHKQHDPDRRERSQSPDGQSEENDRSSD